MSTQTIHYESAIHLLAEADAIAKFHSAMGGSMQPRGLDSTMAVILLADTFGMDKAEIANDIWVESKKLYLDHIDRHHSGHGA